jgi:hypothetical protein
MQRIDLILILTLTVFNYSFFAQTYIEEETGNEFGIPDKFYPHYRQLNYTFTDSLSKVFKLDHFVDSIIKQTKIFDTSSGKLQFKTTSICIFVDSLTLDTIKFDKIKIKIESNKYEALGSTTSQRRQFDIHLSQLHKISVYNFHLNLFEHSYVLSSPNKKSKLIYEREEIDDIQKLLLLDKYIDKQKQLWFKISFTVKKIEPSTEEYYCFKSCNGWVKAGSIYVWYCNY